MNSLQFIIKVIVEYWPYLLRGVGYTMLLSISGTIVGFAIGLLVGVVRSIPMPD